MVTGLRLFNFASFPNFPRSVISSIYFLEWSGPKNSHELLIAASRKTNDLPLIGKLWEFRPCVFMGGQAEEVGHYSTQRHRLNHFCRHKIALTWNTNFYLASLRQKQIIFELGYASLKQSMPYSCGSFTLLQVLFNISPIKIQVW